MFWTMKDNQDKHIIFMYLNSYLYLYMLTFICLYYYIILLLHYIALKRSVLANDNMRPRRELDLIVVVKLVVCRWKYVEHVRWLGERAVETIDQLLDVLDVSRR